MLSYSFYYFLNTSFAIPIGALEGTIVLFLRDSELVLQDEILHRYVVVTLHPPLQPGRYFCSHMKTYQNF
jgi:hypothetical protein